MNFSRTINARRNIISGLINKIITTFMPFVVRTVMIHVLGAEYLGLNSLFSSILQVLNLAELGFSEAVVYDMYKPVADNDLKKIGALLNAYKKIYKIIGCIIMAIGLCLMPILPHLISGNVPDDINIYILYFIYLVNTSLTYWLFAYLNSLFCAYQRLDITNNIGTWISFFMYVVQLIVLLLFQNYYVYLLVMPIFTALNNLLTFIMTRKLFPNIKCYGKIDKRTSKNIKKNVSGLMIQKICATSRNSMDSICVSAFLGLTMTAIYNNYYYILSAVTMLMTIISRSISSGIGNSIACETKAKNHADLCKFNFLYMWGACWCMVCMLCLYQPFMRVWVGEKYLLANNVMLAFCIYFYAAQMGEILWIFSQGAGLFWEHRYRAMGEAVTNIVLNIVLIQFLGVIGIVLATIISLVIFNSYGAYIVFKNYFGTGELLKYFVSQLAYIGAAFLAASATYIIACKINYINEIASLVVRFMLCLVLPNIIYILIFRNTHIYSSSVKWLLSVLHIREAEVLLIKKKYR